MDFMFSAMFGAGVAAFAYSKMGSRLGYGNTGNVWTVVGIAFVMATIVFYTLIKLVMG